MQMIYDIFVNWVSLALFIIFALICEKESRGWSVLWGLCTGAVLFFMLDLSSVDLVWFGIVYVLIGMLWSGARYRRFLQNRIEHAKSNMSNPDDTDGLLSYMRKYKPSEMVGALTTWIVIWPISIMANLGESSLNYIYDVSSSVYRKIYASAISNLSGK